MYVESQGIVQLSEPLPISADSADDALNFIFTHTLTNVDQEPAGTKPKSQALSAIRAAYQDVGLIRNAHVFEKLDVVGEHQRTRMDFAVANGRVVQLTQAWSFQRLDQSQLLEEVRAWAFGMIDLRSTGAYLRTASGDLRIPPSVEIDVVIVPPTHTGSSIMQEARAAIAHVGASIVPVQDVAAVSDRAQHLLIASGVTLEKS